MDTATPSHVRDSTPEPAAQREVFGCSEHSTHIKDHPTVNSQRVKAATKPRVVLTVGKTAKPWPCYTEARIIDQGNKGTSTKMGVTPPPNEPELRRWCLRTSTTGRNPQVLMEPEHKPKGTIGPYETNPFSHCIVSRHKAFLAPYSIRDKDRTLLSLHGIQAQDLSRTIQHPGQKTGPFSHCMVSRHRTFLAPYSIRDKDRTLLALHGIQAQGLSRTIQHPGNKWTACFILSHTTQAQDFPSHWQSTGGSGS